MTLQLDALIDFLDAPLRTSGAEFLQRCASVSGVNVASVHEAATLTLHHRTSPLYARWYASLDAGTPDYGVYATDAYLGEAFACWRIYSRKYLKHFLDVERQRLLGRVRVVVDVGCGIGYTTAALALMFPDAEVIGTQLADTPQWAIAEQLAREFSFELLSELPEHLASVDVVFASEYFEHFIEPCAHWRDLQRRFEPRHWICANTFTSPSIGHFETYRDSDEHLKGAAMSRRFNLTLRQAGYCAVPMNAWNDRPRLWSRDAR